MLGGHQDLLELFRQFAAEGSRRRLLVADVVDEKRDHQGDAAGDNAAGDDQQGQRRERIGMTVGDDPGEDHEGEIAEDERKLGQSRGFVVFHGGKRGE